MNDVGASLLVAGGAMVSLMVTGRGATMTYKGNDTGLVELFLALAMEV